MTPPQRTARHRDPARSRQRLVDAAREVFARKGYAAATVDDIAAAAGISRGSLFWHFGTKDALLWEVVSSAFGRWATEELPQAVGASTGLTAIDLALKSHRDNLAANIDTFRLYHVMMGEALGPRAELADHFVAFHRGFRQAAAGWIREANDEGTASVAQPEAMAFAIVAMISGAVGHWLLETSRPDVETLYATLRDAVHALLRVGEQPT